MTRWCTTVIVAILVMPQLAACTRRTAALGAGEEIDVCRALAVRETFPEPESTDVEALLGYAEGLLRLLDRARPDLPIRRPGEDPAVPPQQTIDDLELLRREAHAFRDALRAAGEDRDRLDQAYDAFVQNDTYNDADARLVRWTLTACPR